MPGRVSVDTLTFEEHDGKTTLTTRSAYDTVEDRDRMVAWDMEAGARDDFDQLDEYLATIS